MIIQAIFNLLLADKYSIFRALLQGHSQDILGFFGINRQKGIDAMAVSLNSSQIAVLVKARQEAHLTQLELSDRSRVALRTIKDLEAGRRTSFHESTLIGLCRELSIEYTDLISVGREPGVNVKRKMVWGYIIAGIVTAGLLSSVFLIRLGTSKIEKPNRRIDWIEFWQDSLQMDLRLRPFIYNPKWNDNEIHINYYTVDYQSCPDESLDVEVKWSYHFVENSTPKYYINAFTEWNPDTEIPLLSGETFWGEGSNVFNFTTISPTDPGVYRIRVFFASAFGPFTSFYGHPGHNQMASPNLGRYLEIPIEVIPK